MADDKEWDFRDRGAGIKQRYTRVYSGKFEGSKPLRHREGGNRSLHVAEPKPGVFLSEWMIDVDYVRRFLSDIAASGNRVSLSLVVDTNVPGHPTVSMQLQEIFIIPG